MKPPVTLGESSYVDPDPHTRARADIAPALLGHPNLRTTKGPRSQPLPPPQPPATYRCIAPCSCRAHTSPPTASRHRPARRRPPWSASLTSWLEPRLGTPALTSLRRVSSTPPSWPRSLCPRSWSWMSQSESCMSTLRASTCAAKGPCASVRCCTLARLSSTSWTSWPCPMCSTSRRLAAAAACVASTQLNSSSSSSTRVPIPTACTTPVAEFCSATSCACSCARSSATERCGAMGACGGGMWKGHMAVWPAGMCGS